MNNHVREFYGLDHKLIESPFEDIIDLTEENEFSFDVLQSKCLEFPKGYFELSQLNLKDRIEFVYSFWQKTLNFIPHVQSFFDQFFFNLDDVGIYLVKKNLSPTYDCHFIYSVNDDHTFYRGLPSISSQHLESLKNQFSETLPSDYLNFLKIHDGFSKDGDLGLIHSEDLLRERRLLQTRVQNLPYKVQFQEEDLDRDALIPFYKSFGLDVYQCFLSNWYPENEMGNTLFSLSEGYISDYNDPISRSKNLVFPTFLDWLVFYMEVVDV